MRWHLRQMYHTQGLSRQADVVWLVVAATTFAEHRAEPFFSIRSLFYHLLETEVRSVLYKRRGECRGGRSVAPGRRAEEVRTKPGGGRPHFTWSEEFKLRHHQSFR